MLTLPGKLLLVPLRAWHVAVAQRTQEPLKRDGNFKDLGPSTVTQGGLNSLLYALRLLPSSGDTLTSSIAAQTTERELGRVKEGCPERVWRGSHILMGGWGGDKRTW